MISVHWPRTGRDGETRVHATQEGTTRTLCTQTIPEGATVGGMLEVTCQQCRERRAYKKAHRERLDQFDLTWKEIGL